MPISIHSRVILVTHVVNGKEFKHVFAAVFEDKLLENRVDVDFAGVSLLGHVEQRRRVDPRVIQFYALENIFHGSILAQEKVCCFNNCFNMEKK